jgi:hypothetical protein
MAIRVQAPPMLCVLGVALLSLAGCDKLKLGGSGDMAYARATLERNSQLEVIAVDPANKVFTVRDKDTKDVKTVRVDEIVGTLPGATPPAAAKPAVTTPTPAPAPIPTQTVENTTPPTDAMQPGEAAAPPENNAPEQTARAEPFTPPEPNAKGVLSGPGYSIKRTGGSGSPMSANVIRTSNSDSSAPGANLSVEHRYEPIVCQGGRLVHIDGRNIEFEGDAVSAEDGCEIHITNSRITAKGVGVYARAANVHIKNSSIEGTTGSVEATNGAQVYVQSSTFKGLSRRLDTATLHDLGGNVWN